MLNLVIKDIAIQKKTLLFAFFYTAFISICFNSMGPNGLALYVVAPILTNYLLVSNAVNYDEKNKSEIVLNSLPLKRDDIVIAKYISIFVFTIMGFIYSILIGFIFKGTGFSTFNNSISLLDIVLVFISVCIFSSIFFPMYFRFGATKMKLFNLLLCMLFILVPLTSISYAIKYPNNILVQKFTCLINNVPSLIQYLLTLVIGLIILLISLVISLGIYKNKEF